MTEAAEHETPGTDDRQAPGGVLDARLARLRRRLRSALTARSASLLVLAAIGLAAVSLTLDRAFRLPREGRLVLLFVLAGAFATLLWRLLLRPLLVPLSDAALADLVESRFPALQDRLRSAVHFRRDLEALPPLRALADDDLAAAMKRHVVGEAVASLPGDLEGRIIDSRLVARSLGLAAAALILLSLLAVPFGGTFRLWFLRNLLLQDIDWPYRTLLVIENLAPGASRLGVPRGDPLTIRVRARGEVPERARIRLSYGRESLRFNLEREGDDLFVHKVDAVSEPFEFTVEGGDYRSRPVEVHVQERPRVEEIAIEVVSPAYTGRPPRSVGGDVAEIAMPEGGTIKLEARASKALRRAWLEGEGREAALEVAAEDPRRFAGTFVPGRGGLVTIHLEDLEAVPPDQLFRFTVTPIPDAAPQVSASARGVGSMITPAARIPLQVRASDDYAVTGLGLRYEVAAEEKEGAAARGEHVPLSAAQEPVPRLEAEPVWEVGPLAIEPDRRLELRVSATDNDALAGPKTAFAPAQSFLVVTPERLAEDFLRREEELRRVFERAIESERAVRDGVYRSIDGPWKEKGALPPAAAAETGALARSQRDLARQLADVALALGLILEEMHNNRIAEASEVERLAQKIIEPLEDLARRLLPATAARLARLRELADAPPRLTEGLALAGEVEDILARMDGILAFLKRLEGFTEIVSRWRAIIRKQDESIEEARKAYDQAVNDLFDDEPGAEGSGGPPGSGPPHGK